MESVRIDNVTRTFGKTVALDKVSLHVGEGEIFFLLGPSGCGKTTLLRIIAGLLEPTSGKIFIGERDITDLAPHLRRTAMVFQNYALWPHMTVAANVQFAMAVRKTEKSRMIRRAREALEIVHMEGHESKKPAQLSGGEQQRVALARAMAADPRCLLLDEPLSNLDANLRVEMRSEIRRICKAAGMTTIYVTHDQKEALSIADRIAVLRGGRIEQVAPPAELYARPATKFVAGFVGETNFIEGTVDEVRPDRVTLRQGAAVLAGVPAGPGLERGSRALCSIRPEKLVLRRGSDAGDLDLRGTIGHVTFLGELTQYEIDMEDGPGLKVIETTAAGRMPAPGEKVRLHFDPEDVNVYPRDDDEA
jgi:iron(III) transport system ATP-binding protein